MKFGGINIAIKRVILHLGMSKTGTRSIQETLFNNADILKHNGFRYLYEWGRNHNGKLRHLFSPDPVKPVDSTWGKAISPRKHQNDIKKLVEKMLNIINNGCEGETLLISGECFHLFFSDLLVENLREFIKNYFISNGLEVSIILLIRNPLSWTISSLQQKIFNCSYPRNVDFFENRMQIYEAVNNLKKNFPDCITLLKFEDAILNKDGLVEYFLKAISFPDESIKDFNIIRAGESRCMEVIEFVNYVESIEPLALKNNFEKTNPNRTTKDLWHIRHINGVKFDLPYHSKAELWERLQKTVKNLKECAGIDYSNYTLSASMTSNETYSEQTIQGFLEAFPKLSPVIQKLFLKFFEMKYAETAQARFKQLYFKGSAPWRIYNERNNSFCLLFYRIKNSLRNLLPQRIKLLVKRI